METEQERAPQSSPVACCLSAPERRARQAALQATVFAEARQAQELADGYALQFAGDAAQTAQLLDFITFERECCPFFTFELHFEPDHGPVWLRLRGPEGTKAFVGELLRGQAANPA